MKKQIGVFFMKHCVFVAWMCLLIFSILHHSVYVHWSISRWTASHGNYKFGKFRWWICRWHFIIYDTAG